VNLHRAFAGLRRPVEACLVGMGGFGRSFAGPVLPGRRHRAEGVEAPVQPAAASQAGLPSGIA